MPWANLATPQRKGATLPKAQRAFKRCEGGRLECGTNVSTVPSHRPFNVSGQAGLLWKMRLGVTDGARTRDNRNHNPALYQLSYGHPQTHWAEKRKPALARPAWRAFTGILAFRPKPWRSLSPVVELFRKAVRTALRRHPLLPPRFRPVPGANHLPGQSHVTNLSLPLERMRHPQRGSRRL